MQGKDRTASDQAEKSNKDTRLGIQDFQTTEIKPSPNSAQPVKTVLLAPRSPAENVWVALRDAGPAHSQEFHSHLTFSPQL